MTAYSERAVTLCAIFRIPRGGITAFQRYEAAVLPLLVQHGGVLRQQLRTSDEMTEIHVIWFPTETALDAFRADPRRVAQAALFEASGTVVEVLTVLDVPIG
jgi:hypothetical protein